MIRWTGLAPWESKHCQLVARNLSDQVKVGAHDDVDEPALKGFIRAEQYPINRAELCPGDKIGISVIQNTEKEKEPVQNTVSAEGLGLRGLAT